MPSKRNATRPDPDECHDCGRAVTPGANFCPGCGADLRPGTSTPPSSAEPPAYCTECGDPFDRGDEYCSTCGAPRSGTGDAVDRDPSRADDAEARQAFRQRVRDHLDAGWELRSDHGDRVVLVDRDVGSIPIHVLLLLTTGGVGNLLYGWYNYVERAETRRLAVDEELPASDLDAPGSHEDPLVTASGYLLSGLLLTIGLGIAAVGVGQGAILGSLFGLGFAAVGLALVPPVERRLGRRHAPPTFGRVRTVDHRITRSTERTDAPCVVCGDEFERGVVRRRRDETAVAGLPVWTHSMRYNHYCADCARAELFGGNSDAVATDASAGVDAEADADAEVDTAFADDVAPEREESTDRSTD